LDGCFNFFLPRSVLKALHINGIYFKTAAAATQIAPILQLKPTKMLMSMLPFRTLPEQKKKLLKSIFAFSQLLSLMVHGLVRLLFYQFPISFAEELWLLVKMFLFGAYTAAGLYAGLALHGLLKKFAGAIKSVFSSPLRQALVLLLVGSVVFTSCESQSMEVTKNIGGKKTTVGVKKDNTTGLHATYKNLEPETIRLVMNGETLNHSDIPLGESFVIRNENVKGLVAREGKVSIGCTLRIIDSAGKVLLQEEDLFKEKDVFDAMDATYLKCTVTTGQPMASEEMYTVQATFWDKYGDGRIANEVVIRSIDMP